MKKLLLSMLVALLLTSCNTQNTEKENEDNGTSTDNNIESSETTDSENSEVSETSEEDDNGLEGEETPQEVVGFSLHTGSDFSFEYPSNWTLSEQSGMVQVVSPLGEDDIFQENVNFMSQDFTTLGLDYDKYYDVNIKGIKDLLEQNSGKIVTEEDVKVSGLDAKRLVYTFSMQGVEIQTTQYFVRKDDTAYIITFTNKGDKPEAFKDEFEKIISSFTVAS